MKNENFKNHEEQTELQPLIEEALSEIKTAKQINRKDIYLVNLNLTEIPKELLQCKDLISINLQSNKLKSLPNWLKKFRNIQEIDISDNMISRIPDWIKELRNLKIIRANENRISSLPDSIGELQFLEELSLENNCIENLPESLNDISQLKLLYLGNNKLGDFPEVIFNQHHLKVLTLNDNGIEELEFLNWSDRLKNLELLDLSNNAIQVVPKDLILLPELHSLVFGSGQGVQDGLLLNNNPIVFPPIEVLSKGKGSVISFYEQSDEYGKVQIFEAKLLIVGAGGAGKTTLIKKLLNPGYKVPCEEESTHGIQIYNYSFHSLLNEQTIHFNSNIWDFGGQEIYHSTHQFFLTKRSLYILVADNRKEDTDFDYWLYTISLFSNNSPMYIILNEKNNRYRELNVQNLKKHFPTLKDVLKVNFVNNRGLAGLRESIEYELAHLDHIGDFLPVKWAAIKDTIQSLDKNYISFEEYISICEEEGLTDEKQIRTISQYLHDLGIILHFQDDLLLDNTLIINPEWGTEAVYEVLDSPVVIAQMGKFYQRDLTKIWSSDKYPKSKHFELLQLMVIFKICYQIEQTRSYIAPQLLPIEEPAYLFPQKDVLNYQYHYVFMPKGILTRFIVNMNRYIENNIVWRNGVVLNNENARAEIVEDRLERKLSIKIQGAKSKEFLYLIKENIAPIHDSFPNLEYKEMIPCVCSECINNNNPEFYELDILKKAISKNKNTIECRRSFEDIPLESLVNAVGLKILDIRSLENLLQKAELENFFERIFHSPNHSNNHEFIVLHSQFNRLKNDSIKGVVSSENYRLEVNKITDRALNLLSLMKSSS